VCPAGEQGELTLGVGGSVTVELCAVSMYLLMDHPCDRAVQFTSKYWHWNPKAQTKILPPSTALLLLLARALLYFLAGLLPPLSHTLKTKH
jgi:hypothetical protein